MATLNTAEWFQLRDRGAIAPGRLADLMVFDSLQNPTATHVYSGGVLVFAAGLGIDARAVARAGEPQMVLEWLSAEAGDTSVAVAAQRRMREVPLRPPMAASSPPRPTARPRSPCRAPE